MLLRRTLSENAHELGVFQNLVLLIELMRLWLILCNYGLRIGMNMNLDFVKNVKIDELWILKTNFVNFEEWMNFVKWIIYWDERWYVWVI